MDYTGISFTKGSSLSAASLNIMNDKINELVRAVNLMQQDHVNVNIEILGTQTAITLETAISQVPEARRQPGVTVKFNELDRDGWSSYTWNGSDWDDTGDWIRISDDLDELDGGSYYGV